LAGFVGDQNGEAARGARTGPISNAFTFDDP
jgi:hypothetical protein